MAVNEPGMFITIEGGEGTGKSTQLSHLAAMLRTARREVAVTREPGGSPGAEAIRALLVNGEIARWDAQSELLLHFAARRDHLVHTVWPALAEGKWVISDRFTDSTMAYQGYGYELGREAVLAVQQVTIGDFQPDLTFILDLPVEEGLARATERDANRDDVAGLIYGEDRYERMGAKFHNRVRKGFVDIARRDPGRCRMIDARQPIDAVADTIFNVLLERPREERVAGE